MSFSNSPVSIAKHIFELQKIGVRRTKYVHREEFSGWLTRLFLPFIKEDEKRDGEDGTRIKTIFRISSQCSLIC